MNSSRRVIIQISVCGRFHSITAPDRTALLATAAPSAPDGINVSSGYGCANPPFPRRALGDGWPVQPTNPNFLEKVGLTSRSTEDDRCAL
jgi:hypothetical protein